MKSREICTHIHSLLSERTKLNQHLRSKAVPLRRRQGLNGRRTICIHVWILLEVSLDDQSNTSPQRLLLPCPGVPSRRTALVLLSVLVRGAWSRLCQYNSNQPSFARKTKSGHILETIQRHQIAPVFCWKYWRVFDRTSQENNGAEDQFQNSFKSLRVC